MLVASWVSCGVYLDLCMW